jgi:hypothetical protein
LFGSLTLRLGVGVQRKLGVPFLRDRPPAHLELLGVDLEQ